jgi:hypothetical protein
MSISIYDETRDIGTAENRTLIVKGGKTRVVVALDALELSSSGVHSEQDGEEMLILDTLNAPDLHQIQVHAQLFSSQPLVLQLINGGASVIRISVDQVQPVST